MGATSRAASPLPETEGDALFQLDVGRDTQTPYRVSVQLLSLNGGHHHRARLRKVSARSQ
jgi:hypothetical protein